ncbi:MAG: tetratricopeptide repeat protein, partial [Bacteroidia bacterium]
DKALSYYNKELELGQKIGKKSIIAEALYLSAAMYGTKGDLEKELEYELKSLEIYKELNKLKSVALILGNISSNYADRGDYKKAISTCEEALEIYKSLGEENKQTWLTRAMGSYYSQMGNYNKAIELMKKAYELAEKSEMKQLLYKADILQDMSITYAKMNNFKNAYYTYLDFQELEDSLNNSENRNFLLSLEAKYETEKKEQEIALLNKDKAMQAGEIERQASQRKALIIVVVLVLFIAIGSIWAFFNNRKKSRLLSRQVNEINIQNEIIKEKNKDITDSIMYAKRLQEAVFPQTDLLNQFFAESFVLFRPKDIVSGDFYWFEKVKDKTIFIVGDCTGHGVPGAFMSILGHNLLNQIILEENILEPAEILETLDKKVISSLNKKGSSEKYNDGMDIGVVVIDRSNNKLRYAGANRPLVIKREGEIIELKQNKFAIGGMQLRNQKVFTQHEIETKKEDTLYLFSDGYYDQFGGPNGKKLKYKMLKDMLVTNSEKSMQEQLTILSENFERWKGTLEQIDDVCVIGVRI